LIDPNSLALFEAAWQARNPEDEPDAGQDDDDLGNDAQRGLWLGIEAVAPRMTPPRNPWRKGCKV
jgi:hypothetical protein